MMDTTPAKKEIGGYSFWIHPMSAMKCACLSGDLASVLVPLMTGIAPFLGRGQDLTDKDIVEAAPAIAGAFSTLSGEKVERLMQALLIDERKIGVEGPGLKGATFLDASNIDTVFAGHAQNMFVLAFHVINANFGDFFGSLGPQFGAAIESLKKSPITESTAS